MTNNDYLRLIEQGVDQWNQWREAHPDDIPDLSRSYLFEADLQGANLQNVNLSRACLIGANLEGADLRRADLNGVYASKANFTHADLSYGDLSWANLTEAILTEANLTNVKASAANFVAAHLTGACLERWHIDTATNFANVLCDYVYLECRQQERRPYQGQFSGEDFIKLAQSLVSPMSETEEIPLRSPSIATLLRLMDATGELDAPQTTVATLPKATPMVAEPLVFRNPEEGRSPSWFRNLLIGLGVGAMIGFIGYIVSQRWQADSAIVEPSPVTVPNLASLPCQEPPPPPLPDQTPDYQYPDSTRYYGKVLNGAPADGRGVMVYNSGNRYDGEYVNGKRNGCGTFTFANGKVYSGQFQDDLFDGQGIWRLDNGDRYIGDFRNNRCHGYGTFISTDGKVRAGQWQDGDLIGSTISCDPKMPD